MTNSRDTAPSISTVMVAKFDLKFPKDDTLRQLNFHLPSLSSPKFLFSILKNAWRAKSASTLFISNPQNEELLFIFIAKALFRNRLKTIVFDLIMKNPGRRSGRLPLWVKRKLLAKIDTFIFIHKDVAGYEQIYGVPRARCQYVPFKANNVDLADTVVSKDGDYVVALGASQRDYKLLVDAIGGSTIPVKIILPESSIVAHRANIGHDTLPENVQHIKDPVDRIGWSRYIAESKLVAIPIIPGTIQPAGISVYLEAMILGKPVVITRGASTEGILHDDVAITVPPGDAVALRKAILEVWNSGELRRRLAENGRRYARSLGNHDRLLGDLRSVVYQNHAETPTS